MTLRALKGGIIVAGTTTPQSIDLQVLLGSSALGQDFSISCPSQDVWFCGADTTSTALVTTATPASQDALVADRAPAGFGKIRTLLHRYLIVRTVAGADLITIKPV